MTKNQHRISFLWHFAFAFTPLWGWSEMELREAVGIAFGFACAIAIASFVVDVVIGANRAVNVADKDHTHDLGANRKIPEDWQNLCGRYEGKL